MTVYADILILINFLIDYFLLRATDILLKCGAKPLKMILSALLGGVFSLYIFFPKTNALLDSFIKLSVCFVLSFICFGFKNISFFIRTATCFSLLNFAFGGLVFAACSLFSPKNAFFKNSVVYFNISPFVLIVSSVIFYFIIALVKILFGKKLEKSERCTVVINLGKKSVTLKGIIDSGNALTDLFGKSAVLIIDSLSAKKIFTEGEILKSRYRIIPVKTVSGQSVLTGYRLDSAKIVLNGKITVLKNAVAAISKTDIEENCAIINPDVIE